MIAIAKTTIGFLADDGYRRELIIDSNGNLIGYLGLAKDFQQDSFKIINKDESAQDIIDDVDELVHVPWD